VSAAKFWPREYRNLIGPLTIELSTEVNCLRLAHNFDPTAIAKEQPRNKSAEVKCVALINSRRSRRIITISFSPENGVRLTQAVSHLEQRSRLRVVSNFGNGDCGAKYSNSEVCIPFYRIVSWNFHLTAFS